MLISKAINIRLSTSVPNFYKFKIWGIMFRNVSQVKQFHRMYCLTFKYPLSVNREYKNFYREINEILFCKVNEFSFINHL